MMIGRSRRAAAVVACSAALAALGGCGGADELTRAELTRQVNAACRDVLSAQADAAAVPETSPAERMRRLSERLDEIEAPSELRDRYDDLRASLRAVAELAPEAGSQEALSSADRAVLAVQLGKLVTATRALRLTDCV